MAIDKPTAVFVAETNVEAHVIANLLCGSGIEAHAVEDVSPAGMYSLGTLDEIHRPRVFVSSEQVGAAREFIARYQTRSQSAIDASRHHCCYFCGAACESDVAECPSCGQLLEGRDEEADEETGTSARPAKASGFDALRNIKRLVAILLLTPIVIYLGLVLIAAAMSFLTRIGR